MKNITDKINNMVEAKKQVSTLKMCYNSNICTIGFLISFKWDWEAIVIFKGNKKTLWIMFDEKPQHSG